MIDYIELLSTLIFFSLIGIFLIKDRKKTERYGIIFIRRWKKGLEIIDSLIKKHEKIVSTIGWIAVVIGIIAGSYTFTRLFIADIELERIFGFVLPTVSGYQIPGPVVSVPFWYWIIGIFILMFVHESGHAIFARFEKVKLKNYGIILLFLLPIGAFVDPDMKKVKKLKSSKKLKIFAAGSFANFLLALVILILSIGFSLSVSAFLIEPKGVFFNETVKGYPAYEANLTGVINSINGIEVKRFEDFSKILNNTKVGEEIEMTTSVSTYKLITAPRPDNPTLPFIGISYPRTAFGWKAWVKNYTFLINIIKDLLVWLFVLNFAVGVANLLPWKPFDGGLIFEEIATKIFKDRGRLIANIFTVLTICLIVFNMFGVEILKRII